MHLIQMNESLTGSYRPWWKADGDQFIWICYDMQDIDPGGLDLDATGL